MLEFIIASREIYVNNGYVKLLSERETYLSVNLANDCCKV